MKNLSAALVGAVARRIALCSLLMEFSNLREEEVVQKAVLHHVQTVEQKAEHVGHREAFCNREKAWRKRVLFVRRVRAQRACWCGEVRRKVVLRHCAQRLQEHVVQHVVEVDVVEERDGVRINERIAHTAMPSRVASRRPTSQAALCSRRCARAKRMHILPTGDIYTILLLYPHGTEPSSL